VIGIFTSRAMRERGRYQIQFMKTRSSSGVGQKVDLAFDVETLRISDLGEESQTSFSQQKTSNTQNIVQQLKRSSVIKETDNSRSEDPTDGIPVPKVKASADSTRIREMIAKLNSEKD